MRPSPRLNLLTLWGAAQLINGSCSDDAFRDFRVWLVGRGRHAYESALKNPDTLADILDGDPVDGFGLDAAALRVYEAKTGMSDFYDRLDREEKDSAAAAARGRRLGLRRPGGAAQALSALCASVSGPAGRRGR